MSLAFQENARSVSFRQSLGQVQLFTRVDFCAESVTPLHKTKQVPSLLKF